ncbi:MAG: flagellar biosynthesis anti-sigma factor FlgM [Gammaproteobacteria bacterium]|nr:flagellar biosynthesis anti-sigma factor FlgM [Gammaproteobacteria bacterium]
MKIDANKDLAQAQIQNAGKGRESADTKRVSEARGDQGNENPKSNTADTLNLSETAVKLSQLDSAPEDNAQRIAELKAAIEDGTYEISPSRIADKMIKMEGLE